MNITIKEKNEDVQQINVEYSPAEWLITRMALRALITIGNHSPNPADIRLAMQMVNTNATFVEEGEE